MLQKHFKTINSTQIYLKENLDKLLCQDSEIIISCSEQTDGVGRKGNSWDNYSNSLALSFTIKPTSIPSLTPIEIGLLTISFLKEKYKKSLFAKWPNDLLTAEGKKCGGILCQYYNESIVVVGLGLNLGKISSSAKGQYPHGLGSVDQSLELQEFDHEKISMEIYQFFLSHRLSPENIKKEFNLSCFHINNKVLLIEDEKEFIGIFKGLGENGEAIVEIDSIDTKFLSSSLRILN